MAEEPSVLRAMCASPHGCSCPRLPGVPLGEQGSEGASGQSDYREAGSPQEEPHLSSHEVSSKRLLKKFGVSSLFG